MSLDGGVKIGDRASRDAFIFYIICDTSSSMYRLNPEQNGQRFSRGELLQSAIHEMTMSLRRDAEVNRLGHFGVISFNDAATVCQPLTQFSEVDDGGAVLTRGVFTDYKAVWQNFKKVYREDLTRLKAAGAKVYRPAIFFVTDGQPEVNGRFQSDEEWLPAYRDAFEGIEDDLKPRIVALGLEWANPDTLLKLHSKAPRHGRALIANRVDNIGAVIPDLIVAIRNSMAISAGGGRFRFVPPASMQDLCEMNSCPQL